MCKQPLPPKDLTRCWGVTGQEPLRRFILHLEKPFVTSCPHLSYLFLLKANLNELTLIWGSSS